MLRNAFLIRLLVSFWYYIVVSHLFVNAGLLSSTQNITVSFIRQVAYQPGGP